MRSRLPCPTVELFLRVLAHRLQHPLASSRLDPLGITSDCLPGASQIEHSNSSVSSPGDARGARRPLVSDPRMAALDWADPVLRAISSCSRLRISRLTAPYFHNGVFYMKPPSCGVVRHP